MLDSNQRHEERKFKKKKKVNCTSEGNGLEFFIAELKWTFILTTKGLSMYKSFPLMHSK